MFVQSSSTPHNRDTNKKLVKIIYALLNSQESVPFRKPVPHKALGLEDYKKIIKKPIDLNQIRRQNNDCKYKTIEDALDDIQLCWENCKKYNHYDSEVYQQAINLQGIFWNMTKELFPQIYQNVKDKLNEREILFKSESMDAERENKDSKPLNNYEQKSNQQSIENNASSYNKSQVALYPKQGNSRASKHKQLNKMEEQEQSNYNNNAQDSSMNPQQYSQAHNPNCIQVEVNLYQKPSKQNLVKLNKHISNMIQNISTPQQKATIEQVLQILMAHEKNNMLTKTGSRGHKGEVFFNMKNIHISTFYRICKAVKCEDEQFLDIIQ